MNKEEAIKYGKYLSMSPYKYLKDVTPIELKWYQKLYFKVISVFSKKKKVMITSDDGFTITFENGSVINCTKNDGCIRGKRADSRCVMYDWECADQEVVNEVLKEFIKEQENV